jgi:UDP-glucuronate 4-epimerase
MPILVTGAAGFIGMHIAQRLLERGEVVVGLDNLNDYYDPNLKSDRIKVLQKYQNFKFVKGDLIDRELISDLFSRNEFTHVVHMAAQAGVRYSVTNPLSYADCN